MLLLLFPKVTFRSISAEFQAVYGFDIQNTGFIFATLM